MPLPTPFHPRTSALCTSLRWKEWAGYHAVSSYDHCHEPEYHAVRQGAGLMDLSPLHKVDVSGPDAAALLDWVCARQISRLKLGQVGYTCFCDAAGRVLDDGTVTRWDETSFRVTSADPCWGWLSRQAEELDVQVVDVSQSLAALSLQGPNSRDILTEVCDAGDVTSIGFFRAGRATLAGVPVEITRTGYTGDLGYELWIPAERALPVYDALMEAGRPRGLLPQGLDALDVLRLEAGFVLMGCDYFSSRHTLIPSQTSSPFELGLGWTVHTKREAFLGRDALVAEKAAGSPWKLVGLSIDWDEFEALHERFGLPPHIGSGTSRAGVPVYAGRKQVGQATSSGWSPLLKQAIALASIRTPHAARGTDLQLEVTVEYERHTVTATVVDTPFLELPRKRS